MAKHPTSSRVRRDPDQPEDAFLAAVEGTVAWARENSRLLITVGAILAALVVGALYYRNVQQQVEAEAATRFGELQQTLSAGNAQLAIRDLTAFVERFGSASAADQGRLILADLLLREGRAQDAIQALDDLPDDLDSSSGLAAARLLAAAHEALGEPDRAVDIYRRIAGNARFDFERREALGDAARVRLQNGNPEAAAGLYEEILETFGENEQGRGYYEMWLAEARARAAQGQGTTPVTADSVAPADSAPADTTSG